MCMKNRLIKEGRKWLTAMCILTMCGLTYSCSDDYDLPDKKPSWLGASIYDYLVDQKNYTNTVRLIQDLGYQEVLERTGSKTLFVADDDAFAKFYQNNSWGVHKYEDLTRSQKSLLLSSSMLDNAYLLEMMTNISSGSTIAKNQCLRQPTSASATDSIPFFAWDGNDIPQTYNEDDESPDIDYWKRFRTQDKGGIWLALDGSTPLMLHFLAGQMGENNITDEDFETLVGSKREPTDAHIYGSKVIAQDQTCLNGYVDKLDRVLLTPDNMAEMIRTNGKTNIFSHMLDRFSAPFYNASLTSSHLQLTGIRDSVFSKRYFAARTSSGRLDRDPYGNTFQYPLDYDPGWNEYYPEGQQLYTDMGAMFVPSDEVLEKYFLPGGAGEFLMEAYAKKENTAENLIYNIDQIPLRIICKFVQNLMKTSFINTVPSKYITIMNDAKDPMFGTVEGGVEGFRATIDTTLLANNGAVYIMNQVFAPAAYAAVSAPALVGKDMKIFNWAISADDSYITNPNPAPLNAFFSYYLLAMSSRFSFFIPTDDALGTYYDEVTAQKQQPRMLSFYYSTRRQDASAPVKARSYRWDPATNEIGSAIPGSVQASASEINNRLKDLLDSHIIVHSDAEAKTGFGSLNQYYVTKGGSAVKISNQSDYSLSSDFDQTKTGFHVQGGFQIDNDTVCTVLRTYDRRQETTGYGNGMTYVIDKPIQTTMKSVYSVLQGEGETSPFYQFFNLCQVDANLLERAGVADSVKKVEDKDTEIQKYTIFTSSQNGLTDNVRFFNSFRYTVYVPTNEAVLDAIDHGLPTWEEISEVITNGENEVQAATDAGKSEEEILAITRAYKIKAQAMITCLVNFLKYHFQDNSIFADRNAIEPTKYETACINNATNRYRSVKVSSTGNGTLNVRSVYSTDAAGNDVEGPVRKVTDDATLKNIMTRDYTFNAQARNATTIETSSYAVVHQIDGVLNFKQLTNDRYDSDWATTGSARRFIAKYRIRK